MKIRQLSFMPVSSRLKALAALGSGLLYQLCCPLLLLATEQPGNGSTEAPPSAIPAGLVGNPETISLTFTIFKTLGALSLVIGIMLLLLFWLRKMGLAQDCARPDGLITVIDSQMLAPKKQVSVLEVAGTYLVVGLSEQQITLLATLDPNDRLTDAARLRKTFTPLPASFAAMLNKATQAISEVKLKKEPPAHAE